MRRSKFDANGVEIPQAGAMSGVYRTQMQQRGQLDSTGRTQRNGGVMPPSTPSQPSTRPAGYENLSAVQKLMGNANFPRRRGQGL